MDSYFQEKLLLLMLDLLFHLLVEMLDFFIISSNFPAEVAERESAKVYTKIHLSPRVSSGAWAPESQQELGAVGDDCVGQVGPVPQDSLTIEAQQDLVLLLDEEAISPR